MNGRDERTLGESRDRNGKRLNEGLPPRGGGFHNCGFSEFPNILARFFYHCFGNAQALAAASGLSSGTIKHMHGEARVGFRARLLDRDQQEAIFLDGAA
jgi:hypothetical protein